MWNLEFLYMADIHALAFYAGIWKISYFTDFDDIFQNLEHFPDIVCNLTDNAEFHL